MAEREWTAADQARFDATSERLKKATGGDGSYRPAGVFCRHCGDYLHHVTHAIVKCPGCGALVCEECAEKRALFAAQACKPGRRSAL